MPWFVIDTTEEVHARYKVEAADAEAARAAFERGEVTEPTLYEATGVDVNAVEPA